MPRRVLMVELHETVQRLRLGHSVKAIHRQTGRHKTAIRAVRAPAVREGWLDVACELPGEGQIARLYEEALTTASRQAVHPLEAYDEQIQEWVRSKYSFQVIHRLLTQMGVAVSESTVRRWIHRRHRQLPSPVILRATTAGEVMEVDFGYLGTFWDRQTAKQRKVWFFSGRLRHSRRVYREIAFDQSQGTFFRCHIHAFEFIGGVTRSVVADNLNTRV